MPAPKSLPVRPSLASLRKEAKQLARAIAAGHSAAIERARAHLPRATLPLTQRNAQLVIAREYGYDGWQDLTADVRKRLERGPEQAAAQARRLIHDNDVEGLMRLLAEHSELLSWRGEGGADGLLGLATDAYGDSFDPASEQRFTRPDCAELLIDAGAVVMPSVCDGILRSRARGLLQLFQRKDRLPRTLEYLAALGDVDAVRAALAGNGRNLPLVNDAFTIACGFQHEAIASLLLDRCIALDPELGTRVDEGVGRPAFVRYFIDNRPGHGREAGLWKAFVMEQVSRASSSWRGHVSSVTTPSGTTDPATFVRLFHTEPWLLGDAFVAFQAEMIG